MPHTAGGESALKLLEMGLTRKVKSTYEEIPINQNFNTNVLIVGSSGSGKSFLGNLLYKQMQPYTSLIYKRDENYPIPLHISKHRISPRINKNSFLDAFVETQSIHEIGIMGSSIPSTLEETFRYIEDLNFNGMKQELEGEKDLIKKGVLNYVYSKLKLYYPTSKELIKDKRTLPLKNILSMEDMTQEEQIFFTDYILRTTINEIEERGLLIDELHRLKQLNEGIISQIVREIRHKGFVIGITQSLSDLPDSLISNFGTIFAFHSLNFTDLQKYKILDNSLSQEILKLREHEFVEVQNWTEEKVYQNNHIYKVDI
jgi:energy-coupling factor transporter ATP-binding protein EcfA2